VLENEQERRNVVKSSAAWYMTYMMENSTINGTAVEARMENISVAAKTGTTTGSRDRWFAAYTPYYTGVVWCGYDDPEEIILKNSTTNPALKLWKDVMDEVHVNKSPLNFLQPADVINCTYCQDSGLLATEACRSDPRGSRATTRLLFRSDVPAGTCNVHVNVEICSATGNAATEFCSQYEGVTVSTVGLLDVERTFSVRGLEVKDQPYTSPKNNLAPSTGYFLPALPDSALTARYCTLHTAAPEPAVPEVPEPDPDTGLEPVPEEPGTEEPDPNTGLEPVPEEPAPEEPTPEEPTPEDPEPEVPETPEDPAPEQDPTEEPTTGE